MNFNTNKAILYLALVDSVIIGAYGIHVAMGDWPSVIDLDGESNLGAWWGGTKFVFAGCALAAVQLLVGDKAPAGTRIYGLLAISFVYLSADEILSVHEKITEANIILDLGIPMFERTVTGNSHAAWVFVYGLTAIVLLGLFQKTLRRLVESDPQSAVIIISGMAVLVVGAVGFEVAGYYSSGVLRQGSPAQITLEEGLELFGVSIIVAGCMRHLVRLVDETRLAGRTYEKVGYKEARLTH